MKSALSLTLIVCLVAPAEAQAAGQRLTSDVDWSRVRRLEPGTQITVTTNGSQPGTRYVLSVDDSSISVLNLAGSSLPASARKTLRDRATHNPSHLLDAQKGGTFILDKNVRVAPDGVFVAEQKFADLDEVVETVPRHDVVEIAGPVKVRGSVHGAILGAWLGFGVGAAFGTQAPNAASGWSLLTGFTGLGAWLGDRASSHKEDEVIYRARLTSSAPPAWR
jgi:hypothetical protein